MMKTLTLGIDPGLRGAVAALKGKEVLGIWDMPIEAKAIKGNRIYGAAMIELARTIRVKAGGLQDYDRVLIALEEVFAMPGQGVSTMFAMGDSFGCARMFVALFPEAQVEFVRPARWKKALRIPKKAKKTYSLVRARRDYPSASQYLTLQKHEGRAEALLIAKYRLTYAE